MVLRNPNFSTLSSSYLFPEINLRKQLFLKTNPDANLISLGIGDTTEPIPHSIINEMCNAVNELGTCEGYKGYGPESGSDLLRNKIASTLYFGKVSSNDIFISDGAKCDLGRLQTLFGRNATIAIQDPSYPVYLDGSLVNGVSNVILLPCHKENDFFPDLNLAKEADLIYWCSPNNPTGAVSSRLQLKALVDFAKKNGSIIIFDSAYSGYIQDEKLPRSIYEIEGADEVAIEVGSFSKLAGFSGIRLGFTVVPEKLKYQTGESIRKDWVRLTTTIFNGASSISQRGAIAVLEPCGLKDVKQIIAFYLENAEILRKCLINKGLDVTGGISAPYLWVKFEAMTSWEAFQMLMDKYHIVSTPGSGFGPSGEGYLRLSAFGNRQSILEAVHRFNNDIY